MRWTPLFTRYSMLHISLETIIIFVDIQKCNVTAHLECVSKSAVKWGPHKQLGVAGGFWWQAYSLLTSSGNTVKLSWRFKSSLELPCGFWRCSKMTFVLISRYPAFPSCLKTYVTWKYVFNLASWILNYAQYISIQCIMQHLHVLYILHTSKKKWSNPSPEQC